MSLLRCVCVCARASVNMCMCVHHSLSLCGSSRQQGMKSSEDEKDCKDGVLATFLVRVKEEVSSLVCMYVCIYIYMYINRRALACGHWGTKQGGGGKDRTQTRNLCVRVRVCVCVCMCVYHVSTDT